MPPPSGSHPFGFAALRTPSPVDHCRGATKAQFSMGDRNALEDAEVDNLSTNSDFKYGPGIVKKLKAKFHRLSGIKCQKFLKIRQLLASVALIDDF
ncbi:hypothetical protein KIN20_004481 [Parelaphostrongylus tenuis]|uniref:Uncharacterized protein n=1 Tax=Parelaphostrongylus tenuis TaxID=148309 RepID=A0AAD5MH27_PARTN|nr:hypothetical protein KIN20_004481 [Parelaphostrongylus tenuis]